MRWTDEDGDIRIDSVPADRIIRAPQTATQQDNNVVFLDTDGITQIQGQIIGTTDEGYAVRWTDEDGDIRIDSVPVGRIIRAPQTATQQDNSTPANNATTQHNILDRDVSPAEKAEQVLQKFGGDIDKAAKNINGLVNKLRKNVRDAQKNRR